MNPLLHQKYWNFKALFLCHLAAAFLIASFCWPVTKALWEAVDHIIFQWLNGSLAGRPRWQLFWALANHKNADWVEDVCILGFFILYIKSLPKQLKERGYGALIFSLLFSAAVLFFVNRMIFRESVIDIHRESPTLVCEGSIRLSEHIPWLKIKDDSLKSFPGDHGTTALLFAATYTYFAGRWLGFWACVYALFLCIPRMITGAHWLSDVIVGSGTIALLSLSWALCSPFSVWVIDQYERLAYLCKRYIRRAKEIYDNSIQ